MLGAALGVGMLAKYAMAYFLLCLAIYLIATPARRFLLRDGATEWKDLIRGEVSFKEREMSDPVVIREAIMREKFRGDRIGMIFQEPMTSLNPVLPVGFQIVSRAFDEAGILAAGHAYQQATDWHLRRPPLDA